MHDSQKIDDVLDKSTTEAEVWAASARRSAEIEAKFEAQGYKSRVHHRARRNRQLSRAGNTTPSRVRARVEHVFGHQHTSMGGTIVRTIGIVRARAKIGLMNLVYNISRFSSSGRRRRPAEPSAWVESVTLRANRHRDAARARK